MPISVLQPSRDHVSQLLASRARAPLSYACEGATGSTPPRGWCVDEARERVGSGPSAFDAGAGAVRNWVMFDLGWTALAAPAGPPRPGQIVAVRARHLGIWSVNPCRVLSVIDEGRRYGFTYGTVSGHGMCGEERFVVERDGADDVWFSILAVSRPGHLLSVLGYPYVRLLQARFRRDAMRAVRRAVAARLPGLSSAARR